MRTLWTVVLAWSHLHVTSGNNDVATARGASATAPCASARHWHARAADGTAAFATATVPVIAQEARGTRRGSRLRWGVWGEHFHTPDGTVGPLERGLINATNSGENFDGWVVGF